MEKQVEILTEQPLNAQTPHASLRSWLTPSFEFFCRNQGAPFTEPMDVRGWGLTVDGLVEKELRLSLSELLALPRRVEAAALECSGNGRALLPKKARGNRWTFGGVGNAVWAGVPLATVLEMAGVRPPAGGDGGAGEGRGGGGRGGGAARHVVLEGSEQPPVQAGKPGAKFIRSIPIEKAFDSTLLAYEMNGEPLPAQHGHPLRALPLGWTGANSVKWLSRITVSEEPHHGFFMDKVYRVFREGQEPEEGEPVTEMPVKSFVTFPAAGERLEAGALTTILGVAYAGEQAVTNVAVSADGGSTWHEAELLGPEQPYAWRLWQFSWRPGESGAATIMSRATDGAGRVQPESAEWNVLGYGNNGVKEHAVTVHVE